MWVVGIYCVSYFIDSSKAYQCVNTEDGYKIVDFKNINYKNYVIDDKAILFQETFKCYLKDNKIILHLDTTPMILGLKIICLVILSMRDHIIDIKKMKICKI